MRWYPPAASNRFNSLKRVFDIAEHRQFDDFVLVQFRKVDVDVDDRAVLGKFLDLSGDPIVKTNAQAQATDPIH